MWFCTAVFIGYFCTSLVQAACQVEFDQSTTGAGILKTTFDRKPYCAYLGVRYAKPPVKQLRFRHSILHHPSGHHNYTSSGSICPQFRSTLLKDLVLGDEDCLFANIYSPRVDEATNVSSTKTYPVLVFVHGGSYLEGHGEKDIHGVDLLMDSGVLVVTFNYRLHVLGFLKLDFRNISGNYGLKDQTTLLRWVQRYIKYFGGDSDQVTLMGQSAGAAAVSHHLYIPQSEDLFHRLIALSGSLLASWSFMYEHQLCSAEYLTDLKQNSSEQLQLMNFQEFFIKNQPNKYWLPFASMGTPYFIPVQELDEIHGDNFTVHESHKAVLRPPVTRVPILLGETAREFEDVVKDFNQFVFYPNIPLNWTRSTVNDFISSVHDFVTLMVTEGHANSSEEVIQHIASIANLKYPLRRLASDLAQSLDPTNHPIYYLRFEYDGRFGKAKHDYYLDYLEKSEYGAMHGDDLGYIFSPFNLNQALAAIDDYREEFRVHRSTVELIANFIKHGNPTPTRSEHSNITWTALNGNSSVNTYLNIDQTFELRKFEDDKYFKYWEKAYNCLYYYACDEILRPRKSQT
ncbi:juvenile hormone esterase-like [Anopheles marshallii]|uniref:juvenile hormone esterase-like n=1 Tax=Anopheles marshallii TaxID=1521116 RepID=UPI00237B6804|nr:juvenile hormone esterase-like [Anopheles marshallii]